MCKIGTIVSSSVHTYLPHLYLFAANRLRRVCHAACTACAFALYNAERLRRPVSFHDVAGFTWAPPWLFFAFSCSSIFLSNSIFCLRAAGVQCFESMEGCFVQIFFMSVGVKPDASSSAINDSAALVEAWRMPEVPAVPSCSSCLVHRSVHNKAMVPKCWLRSTRKR